jgi:hypothetical protein
MHIRSLLSRAGRQGTHFVADLNRIEKVLINE